MSANQNLTICKEIVGKDIMFGQKSKYKLEIFVENNFSPYFNPNFSSNFSQKKCSPQSKYLIETLLSLRNFSQNRVKIFLISGNL